MILFNSIYMFVSETKSISHILKNAKVKKILNYNTS